MGLHCPCRCPGRCPWLGPGRLGTVPRLQSRPPPAGAAPPEEPCDGFFCGRLLTHCCRFAVIILSFAAMPMLLLLIPRRADDLQALALCLFAAAPHHNTRVADDLGALALCLPGWVSEWQDPCFVQQAAAALGACDGRGVGVSTGLIANLSVFSSLAGRHLGCTTSAGCCCWIS